MSKPDGLAASEADIRAGLIATAREFERVSGMAKSTIGKMALNDPNFLFRVEAGNDFTMRKYRKLTEWFRRNWPRDTVPAAK